jgi:hypothetical protein
MIPNAIIDKLSKAFNIEQEIISNDNELTLVTRSKIKDKVVYEHHLDMLPLLEEMKKRL